MLVAKPPNIEEERREKSGAPKIFIPYFAFLDFYFAMRRQRIRDYKHVSWDWNGTLLDDTEICLECLNAVANGTGFTAIDLARYREIYGFPVKTIYAALGMPTDAVSFRNQSIAYMDTYERRRRKCGLHDGARELLEKINDTGVAQSIFSAYPQDFLEAVVDEYGLRSFFKKLSGNDNIFSNDKAHRAEKHFAELGVAPEEILYCGDTTHDAEVARACGVDCLLIAGGHQARHRLENMGARVIGAISEMEKLF